MAARAPTTPTKSKATPIPMEEQIRRQTDDLSPVEERIRRRAHEIYLECGGLDGSDLDHWLQAESEILGEQGKKV